MAATWAGAGGAAGRLVRRFGEEIHDGRTLESLHYGDGRVGLCEVVYHLACPASQ